MSPQGFCCIRCIQSAYHSSSCKDRIIAVVLYATLLLDFGAFFVAWELVLGMVLLHPQVIRSGRSHSYWVHGFAILTLRDAVIAGAIFLAVVSGMAQLSALDTRKQELYVLCLVAGGVL